MRVKDVESMIDMYPGSEDYGKPFGVAIIYADGHCERFTDLGLALCCAGLTIRQRKYIRNLQKEIKDWA